MKIQTETLGYPRMGKKREVKKALEAFWGGKSDEATLRQIVRDVETANWKTQLAAGIDRIAVGDMSFYDLMLDWSVRLGIIPDRFRNLSGIERYFAMTRGKDGIPALEMTKWFDTNYHYLVPEIDGTLQPPDFSDFIATVKRAQTVLGDRVVPVVIGPLTLLRLSRLDLSLEQAVEQLTPRYVTLLEDLKNLGVVEVQIHEPALVLGDADQFQPLYESTIAAFAKVGLPIHLVTYFDDLGDTYPWAIQLPVSAISLDFTRGNNLELLKTHGFPAEKRLGVGMVDGRNIWKVRPEATFSTLKAIQGITSNISLHPSASLQFVPYDATLETQLPDPLRNVLSFAEQKLGEVVFLGQFLAGEDTAAQQSDLESCWQAFATFNPGNPAGQEELQKLTAKDFERSQSYSLRVSQQVKLPPLPTTTIGSFPQTKEVRQLRVKYKRGELTEAEYQAAIDAHIAECIKTQLDIGLDVLVHGEFERTDMVEYFGQQLEGFAFTVHGWVQSYGSRCVRPPIIYGDVSRPDSMTLREYQVAQALTEKPVKGMLSGPVTILNWSFPRGDISRRDQAFQIALALRQEVADLEAAGARIIQVDEPAFREGLPLKTKRWSEYLTWAVDAFRLSTAIAQPQTQIHTHMCYSEFGDIIRDIENLDADVISIENSRSNNRTLKEVTEAGYSHQIGNGVYDIHSPVVPTTDQLMQQLKSGIANLPTAQIWVNPDCGLKTRRWEEVVPSLKHMVQAAQLLRQELESSLK